MGEYKFYQDRKVTSWERDYFSVKQIVTKKPRQSSAHGTVRTCRTSLTTVFAMKSGKH